jgi:four helix bundle protein
MNDQTPKEQDLSKRTRTFAVDIIRLVQTLPKSISADVVARQLVRSATSVGANYLEAKRSRSPADFISRITITEQEAAESQYWLQILSESQIVDNQQLSRLLQEANELTAIFTASGKTAKLRHGRK